MMISYQLDVITHVCEHGRLQTERRSGLGGRVCKDDTEQVPTLLTVPGCKDCIPVVVWKWLFYVILVSQGCV